MRRLTDPRRLAASTALVVALAAPTAVAAEPRLWIERAHVDVARSGTTGTLHVEGSFAGVTVDPARFVVLSANGSTRWSHVRRVDGRSSRYAVTSAEHGYALRLDLARGRFSAVEPDVTLDATASIRLALGDAPAACALLHFRRGARRWTFDARRDRQTACPPVPAPTPAG